MSTDEATEKICKALEDLATAIRSNANSPLRASSEQSVVGQPERFESENPALARPVTLSELKILIMKDVMDIGAFCVPPSLQNKFRWIAECIRYRLKDVDQGPVAQCPSEDEIVDALIGKVNKQA